MGAAACLTILPPALAANDEPAGEVDDRPTEPGPPPAMVDLAPIDVTQALPDGLRELFVARPGDGFVRLEIVTMSTSDARRRKLDRAMSALIDAGFEVWPGEDERSLEVSRPEPPEHITATIFAETEPAPGELAGDLAVLASEAAARGFDLVAAEIRSLSREVAGGEMTSEEARVAFLTFAEVSTAAGRPTYAELYERAAEACERAMQRGGR